MTNPYHPREQLADLSWFYGRERELHRLLGYLSGPHPLNVSLVGQRRIGKTWLLKRIYRDQDLRHECLDDAESYVIVYLDLQEEKHRNRTEDLSSWLFCRFREELLGRLPPAEAREYRGVADPDGRPYEVLRQTVEYVAADKRIVFLLDGFDGAAASDALDDAFFGRLRSLLGVDGVGSVVASYRPLRDAARIAPDSPLFNIFNPMPLGLLDDEDAERFVEDPCAAAGVRVSPSAMREILDLAGPHPCALSQLCFMLLSGFDGDEIRLKDVRAQQIVFRTAVSGDLADYWERLTDDQRSLVAEIAAGNRVTNTASETLRSLEIAGIIRTLDGEPRLFSRAFSNHVTDTRATDVYFQDAFSDPSLSSVPFQRMLQVILAAASHIPDDMRGRLGISIADMRDHPHHAIAECGRHVMPDLLRRLYAALGVPWDRFATDESRINGLKAAMRDEALPATYEIIFIESGISGTPPVTME